MPEKADIIGQIRFFEKQNLQAVFIFVRIDVLLRQRLIVVMVDLLERFVRKRKESYYFHYNKKVCGGIFHYINKETRY